LPDKFNTFEVTTRN